MSVSNSSGVSILPSGYIDATKNGVVGDGVTDTRAALVSLISKVSAAGGGTIYLPAGTYIVSGTGTASEGAILLKDNITLVGDGMGLSTVKLIDSYGSAVTGIIRTESAVVNRNIIVRDLTIDGNKANNALGNGTVIGLYTGVSPSIAASGVTRSGSTATLACADTGSLADNDTVHVFAEDPETTESEYLGDFTITNVVVDTSFDFTVSGTPTSPATGNILFYPSSEANASDYDITIERVECKDCNDYGFDPHERTTRLKITNCYGHDNDKDNFVADYIIDGVYENCYSDNAGRHGYNITTATTNFKITECASDSETSNGIIVQKGNGTTPDCRDITVSNNSVKNSGVEGIKLRVTHNFTVEGNLIREAGRDGVELNGTTYGVVTGNVFDNNGTASNNAYYDIQLLEESGTEPSQYNIIAGNTMRATGTNKVKNHILEVADSSGNNIYGENNFDSNAVGDDIAINSTVISAAGAIPLDAKYVSLAVAAGTYAVTLAAPTSKQWGMVKVVEMIDATGTSVTLALTNVIGGSAGSTATFDAVNESLTLIAVSNKWVVLDEHGVTLS
jgi:parallel beta-helix repeat protein